jgi:hypothetical protein
MLSDTTYGFIKNLVQLILPGFATLYLSLAQLWHLPYANEVSGTTAALAAFLGLLLRISSKSYNASDSKFDGKMVVTTNEEGATVYSLELNGDPAEMAGKDAVSFKVGSI